MTQTDEARAREIVLKHEMQHLGARVDLWGCVASVAEALKQARREGAEQMREEAAAWHDAQIVRCRADATKLEGWTKEPRVSIAVTRSYLTEALGYRANALTHHSSAHHIRTLPLPGDPT